MNSRLQEVVVLVWQSVFLTSKSHILQQMNQVEEESGPVTTVRFIILPGRRIPEIKCIITNRLIGKRCAPLRQHRRLPGARRTFEKNIALGLPG